ncbi:unnamed protein product [Darwinula stevensoni]|uniref:Uncharacterized protein n=1 Tax=Darwinula stevensoni TaxID=69355 RepID=A0A7R9ABB9_9CRUS|nr:unnamed protein product [Darwinula stevensoni]CAG0899289.1 unnamed protein product [Darwinula stevensoni]
MEKEISLSPSCFLSMTCTTNTTMQGTSNGLFAQLLPLAVRQSKQTLVNGGGNMIQIGASLDIERMRSLPFLVKPASGSPRGGSSATKGLIIRVLRDKLSSIMDEGPNGAQIMLWKVKEVLLLGVRPPRPRDSVVRSPHIRDRIMESRPQTPDPQVTLTTLSPDTTAQTAAILTREGVIEVPLNEDNDPAPFTEVTSRHRLNTDASPPQNPTRNKRPVRDPFRTPLFIEAVPEKFRNPIAFVGTLLSVPKGIEITNIRKTRTGYVLDVPNQQDAERLIDKLPSNMGTAHAPHTKTNPLKFVIKNVSLDTEITDVKELLEESGITLMEDIIRMRKTRTGCYFNCPN